MKICAPNRDDRLQKVHKLDGVRPVAKVKIDALVHLPHIDAIGLRVVLEDKLLQEEKRTFVRDVLPKLHARDPAVGVGSLPCAVRAHVGLHNKLNDKRLLQNGTVEHLCLHGQLDLEAPAVWLCPNKARIHQLDLSRASCSYNSLMPSRGVLPC